MTTHHHQSGVYEVGQVPGTAPPRARNERGFLDKHMSKEPTPEGQPGEAGGAIALIAGAAASDAAYVLDLLARRSREEQLSFVTKVHAAVKATNTEVQVGGGRYGAGDTELEPPEPASKPGRSAPAAPQELTVGGEPQSEPQPQQSEPQLELATQWDADQDTFWAQVGEGCDDAEVLAMVRAACTSEIKDEESGMLTVDLLCKNIRDGGMRVLGAALAAMPAARAAAVGRMRFADSYFTDAGAAALAPGLRRCVGLRECWLCVIAEFSPVGLAVVTMALAPTLRNLRLTHCKMLGDDGLVVVAATPLPMLEELTFDGCRVGTKGFSAVAEAVPRWPNLNFLVCDMNIGPADTLAGALVTHSSTVAMVGVQMTRVSLGAMAKEALQQALEASGCPRKEIALDSEAYVFSSTEEESSEESS